MTVSVVVPFRPDGAERDRNWAWLKPLYTGWEVVEADCDGQWRKGVALSEAAKRAGGNTLLIADADIFVPRGTLEYALTLDAPWVVPQGKVYRWGWERTERVVAGLEPPTPKRGPFQRGPRMGPAGGGMVVVSRENFDKVGGIDQAFVGWGGEDISFGWALDTLVGRHVRLGVPVAHLFHEPSPMRPGRRACETSERLANAYRAAHGNVAAMEALVRGDHVVE